MPLFFVRMIYCMFDGSLDKHPKQSGAKHGSDVAVRRARLQIDCIWKKPRNSYKENVHMLLFLNWGSPVD